MSYMFYNSSFNRDISRWEINTDADLSYMFDKSPLYKNGKFPLWYLKKVNQQ